jgi:CBS-domain-containing membrane protein
MMIGGGTGRDVPLQVDRGSRSVGSTGSVLVGELSSVPARVYRVVLATGARSPVAELARTDRAAASYIYAASFSADERSHAYSLVRNRSYLYGVISRP